MPHPQEHFSETSLLMDVLRDPAGKAVVDKHLPTLSTSSILHTLFGYPIGLVTATDPQLTDKGARQALLSELATIPVPAVTERPRSRSVLEYSDEYESPDVERGSASAIVPSTAAVFQRVDVVFSGPSHGNPYLQVNLRAVVTTPTGEISVTGFYDGDGRYRLRWLPEVAGKYSFVTTSNARSLDGVTGEITAAGPEAGARGPVRVDDQYHFAYATGEPHVPVGTTSYAWIHQPGALQDQTVAQLANSPFNKMRMCVFPKSYLFNENEPEIFPYLTGPEGIDFDRFDPAFWANLEHRVDQLQELGIEADLILFHAYDRWGFATMTADQDDRLVRYTVARLSSFANVWWSLANEFDLLFDKTEEDWESFATLVQDNDPTGHLLSIHNCRFLYDHSRSWVTHVSIQRQDVYKTAEMITEWRDRWGKPVVLDEAAYEGNIDQGWGNIPGQEMVRRFWEGAVRGGYVGHGETYVDPDDILWWAKGGTLHGTSPARIQFLRTIIEDAPGGRLNPVSMDWDVPSAGVDGVFYLYYFGFYQPSYRRFLFDPQLTFEVDIIDTWNMTIETLPGTRSGRFVIQLPAKQYIAVRLRAVSNALS